MLEACVSVITLRDVSIRYGEGSGSVLAVDSFNLEVEENEFLCLLGPSGCGKSTVLKAIAGLIGIQGGETSYGPGATRSTDRFVVWQEPTLMPWRTILRNVTYPLELAGLDKHTASTRARHQLDLLGIGEFADKYPRQLSGGMRQRAGIARALVADPNVLLMDEPFAALDAQTRRLLQEQLLELWNGLEKTVVFVTHSVEEAILLGDRIAVMTARPGMLKEIIEVPFRRPRSPEIRHTAEYQQLEQRIWQLLHSEAEKAVAEVEGQS
jgi:NitT/TauT family transport system ATP-binding protein